MQNPARQLGLSKSQVELFDYFCYLAHGIKKPKLVASPCDKVAMELVTAGLLHVCVIESGRKLMYLTYTPKPEYLKVWEVWFRANFNMTLPRTKHGKVHARTYPNRYLYDLYRKNEEARAA